VVAAGSVVVDEVGTACVVVVEGGVSTGLPKIGTAVSSPQAANTSRRANPRLSRFIEVFPSPVNTRLRPRPTYSLRTPPIAQNGLYRPGA